MTADTKTPAAKPAAEKAAAEKAAREPREVINASIPRAHYDALVELRFARRHDRLQDTIREAVAEYVEKHSA